MTDFFRSPPPLAWLGSGTPGDDKLLPGAEAEAILAREVMPTPSNMQTLLFGDSKNRMITRFSRHAVPRPGSRGVPRPPPSTSPAPQA